MFNQQTKILMMKTPRLQKAYSIMEIMITVIIVSVIAGFGIASFQKAGDKNIERGLFVDLRVIMSAMEIYRVRHQGYVPGAVDLSTVGAINAALTINILGDNATYSCTSDPADYQCTASSNEGFALRVGTATVPALVIHCSAGTCPSCDATSCPY
jgi:type II secretory pathway pseudopilin PulG